MGQTLFMLFMGASVAFASLVLQKHGAPDWLTFTSFGAGAITMFTSLFLAARF